MARTGPTSLKPGWQGTKFAVLAAVFVLAQIMVGYHHVGKEHADDHDGFAIECDICTIAATGSGSPEPSFLPDAPQAVGLEPPYQSTDVSAGLVARPGGPRAPPQTS